MTCSILRSLVRPRDTSTPPLETLIFWLRAMASDLKVLVLIPGTLHLAANCPSTFWRSWFTGANRTTPSAKSRAEIRWLLNWTPSGPCWLMERRDAMMSKTLSGDTWWLDYVLTNQSCWDGNPPMLGSRWCWCHQENELDYLGLFTLQADWSRF